MTACQQFILHLAEIVGHISYGILLFAFAMLAIASGPGPTQPS